MTGDILANYGIFIVIYSSEIHQILINLPKRRQGVINANDFNLS